ncbi:hypothetical protein E2C01_073826 [Portunus trituberculatus]|uniref:Uncharacterized protein n=1 Tax=Portunus trituberculatus TaxID=210409 RepID=A0A5B7IAQ9_PORTR|nr:hypothetical protein [Portunus trituberculatus]
MTCQPFLPYISDRGISYGCAQSLHASTHYSTHTPHQSCLPASTKPKSVREVNHFFMFFTVFIPAHKRKRRRKWTFPISPRPSHSAHVAATSGPGAAQGVLSHLSVPGS